MDVTLDQVVGHLEQMDYRGAIIGPHGSGKTTLLGDIGTALKRRGMGTKSIFVNDTTSLTQSGRKALLRELTSGEVVLLDGADHVNRFIWPGLKKKILRKAGGLVITSHRKALLPTLIQCSTNALLFRELVDELESTGELIDRNTLDAIYHENNGNVRAAFRQLYDICALL